MKTKLNAILSVGLLVFLIPATLGFALIHHNCQGCECHEKETAFLIIPNPNHHNHFTCSCAAHDNTNNACHSSAEATCSCMHTNGEHHPDCDVDLKKFEVPFTFSLFSKWIPEPTIINIALIPASFVYNEISEYPLFTNSGNLSPPVALSGAERLILHSVYRL
ncbi:hypothetical protein [Alkaliflexus imshenetskii]|uniref:hypothetical protein n=1 Tax=Alkaliflexus imshenetskii TaxID=286730 RepID=UPI0012F7F8D0|nr:hypothetical protein [Alkaliflexus imshenetskii]